MLLIIKSCVVKSRTSFDVLITDAVLNPLNTPPANAPAAKDSMYSGKTDWAAYRNAFPDVNPFAIALSYAFIKLSLSL